MLLSARNTRNGVTVRTWDALDEVLVGVPLLLVALPVVLPAVQPRPARCRGRGYRTVRRVALLALALVHRGRGGAVRGRAGRRGNIAGCSNGRCVRLDVFVVCGMEVEASEEILGTLEMCPELRLVWIRKREERKREWVSRGVDDDEVDGRDLWLEGRRVLWFGVSLKGLLEHLLDSGSFTAAGGCRTSMGGKTGQGDLSASSGGGAARGSTQRESNFFLRGRVPPRLLPLHGFLRP